MGETCTNASTTAGSKWVPFPPRMGRRPHPVTSAHGRFRVRMASHTSTTAMMRPGIGICPPLRPCGIRCRSTTRGGCRRCPWRWRASGRRAPAARSTFSITARPCAEVLAHLGQFVGRQLAGFVEHAIGYADLADVVERRQAGEELDALRREVVVEAGMLRQLLREDARVFVFAPNACQFRDRGCRSATAASAPSDAARRRSPAPIGPPDDARPAGPPRSSTRALPLKPKVG